MNFLNMVIIGCYQWQRKYNNADEAVFNTTVILSFVISLYFLTVIIIMRNIIPSIEFLRNFKSWFGSLFFLGIFYIPIYYKLIRKKYIIKIFKVNRHKLTKCKIAFTLFSLGSVITIMFMLYLLLLRNKGEISF